jgi:hypothetical protein
MIIDMEDKVALIVSSAMQLLESESDGNSDDTILPSESGVTLYYNTILDHHFAMLTFIFEPTSVISRY